MTTTAPRIRSASPPSRSGGGGKFLFFLLALILVGGVGYLALSGKLPGLEAQPTPSSSTNQPVLIGQDPQFQFLTGSDGEGKARGCVPTAVVNEKRCCPQVPINDQQCDDIKVVVIDAIRMPFIARNIWTAWTEGKPSVLHKEAANSEAKYRAHCSGGVFTRKFPGIGSCDEFPFKSSLEGWGAVRVEEVHTSEQDCQGGTISQAYRRYNVQEGDEYIVLIAHPENIPGQAWAGQAHMVTSCDA